MSTDGRNPCLARSWTAQNYCRHDAAENDKVFYVESQWGLDEGRPVFCCDKDLTEVEYLGAAQSLAVTPAGEFLLTTQFGLAEAKSKDWRLWSPVAWCLFSQGENKPEKVVSDGVERVITFDGLIHPFQTADASTLYRLTFERGLHSNWSNFRDFVQSSDGANNGLNEFVLACWDFEADSSVIWQVQLEEGLPTYRNEDTLSAWSFGVQVLGTGYPDVT